MIRRHLEAELLGAATGRRYQIDVTKLDAREQEELLRLIRDLKSDRDSARRTLRTQPWKLR